MSMWLKQSTAIDVSVGPFVDETDGKTAETGLTITQPDIRLKKNGGAWAQKNAAQTLSHEENGWYEISLDATDTNTLGNLLIAVHESGALPVWREFQVVPANIWDSFFGADVLQVDVQQIVGAAVSTSTAQLGVNAVQAGGTAWGSGAITAASIANGAIDAATFAADVDAEILSYLVDDATRIDASALNTAAVTSIPAILEDTGTTLQAELDGIQADTEDIQTRLPAALVSGRIDASVGAMAANVMTAAAAAADLTTELQSGLATAADLATVDTVVDAIKAKTDSLTFTVAGQVDANIQSVNDVTVTGTGAAGDEWGP